MLSIVNNEVHQGEKLSVRFRDEVGGRMFPV
jgi:hypothetical protein